MSIEIPLFAVLLAACALLFFGGLVFELKHDREWEPDQRGCALAMASAAAALLVLLAHAWRWI